MIENLLKLEKKAESLEATGQPVHVSGPNIK